MKTDGSNKIMIHMRGMLLDMKRIEKQCLQFGESCSLPDQYLRERDDLLARVNLFWPFWKNKAEAHGADRLALFRLETEMNLARIALKRIGKKLEIA